MREPPCIAVYPEALFEKNQRLWEALAVVGGVRFRAWEPGDESRVKTAWLQGPDETLVNAVTARGGRCLVWPGEEAAKAGVAGPVEFSQSGELDPVVRGARFRRHEAVAMASMAAASGAGVMATLEGRPVWVRERGARGAVVDRLAVGPVVLSEGRLLRQHLKPWDCARLLPVLHVLREMSTENGWEAPPQRACFVFDDPCLRRPTYGCLGFEALAQHAAAHGYHAAIATVPHDAWAIDPSVCALFGNRSEHLSLLIHGNDHTRHEMWRDRPEAAWTAMLAQALRRVARFEQEHGLAVARVMEAPHALVARGAFGPMGRVGFEGALVSPALARVFGRQGGWPVSLGCAALDEVIEGVSPLPRIPLSSHWREDVVLAAFLRQPILVAGHHQDAAEGFGFFEELAAWVNRVEGVRWSGLNDVLRSRWQGRRVGNAWHLTMGARRVEVQVPAGVTALHVERRWESGPAEELRVSGPGNWQTHSGPNGSVHIIPLPEALAGPVTLRIESRPDLAIDPHSVPAPHRRAWPSVRRFMAEARDRMFPYVPGAQRRRPPAYRVP